MTAPATTDVIVSGRLGPERFHVPFTLPPGVDPAAGATGEAALTLLLVPAMTRGETLSVDEPVSPRLLAGVDGIQRILATWDRRLTVVDVEAPTKPVTSTTSASPAAPAQPAAQDGRGVGSFFSGGVDSFDTLLAHRDEITHLIFLEGFDIDVDDRALGDRARAAAAAVAADLGKELVVISTGVRRLFPHVEWSWWHGGCLAAAALLLQDHLHTVHIPGSASWSELAPWGSHPGIDPLWSTERLAFHYDGVERDRFTKTAALADEQVALDHLRVCWENRDGAYNCGRCEKCLRTMLHLHLAGALARARTFPDRLDLDRIARMRLDEVSVVFQRDTLAYAKEKGADAELVRALERTIRAEPFWSLIGRTRARARRAILGR